MELRNFKNLKTSKLYAEAEKGGKIEDLYFDESNWVSRYLVVDTGGVFDKNKVLLSPMFLNDFEWDADQVSTYLTKEQIEGSPDWDSHKPVSRQYELSYFGYFQRQPYWAGSSIWGSTFYPHEVPTIEGSVDDLKTEYNVGEPSLRSAAEVKGYAVNGIDAKEGRFGKVKDFLFDLDTWTLRYFVIDTIKYLPSKKVLISPEWVRSVDWAQREININITKDQVRSAPEYDTSIPPSRAYENELYKHYRKAVFWDQLPGRTARPAA